jgi:hypothetical protein
MEIRIPIKPYRSISTKADLVNLRVNFLTSY